MTTQSFNTANELRRIIAEGGISEDALQAITGISQEKLQAFLDEEGEDPEAAGLTTLPQPLSGDEGARLSILASQITQGLEIGDDERLQGILEALTSQFQLTLQNLAMLTLLDVEDLDAARRDPISAETKYALASRLTYLVNAINQAQPGS